MRQLTILTVFISTLFVTFVSSNTEDLTDILPESHHSKLFREIYTQLATSHYSTVALNDQLSEAYLTTYIDRLDSPKRFFMASSMA